MNHQRVYAEINLDAIIHNFHEINNWIGPDCKIMGVIKADGYGHGAVAVAKILVEEKVDVLAVAMINEAVALRKYGMKLPIMILGYTADEQLGDLVKYDIIQTVFSLEMAQMISDIATGMGKTATIHIKMDTGMGRIGFAPDAKALEDITKIYQLPNICVEGLFTHFSSADEEDKETTNKQIQLFEQFRENLERSGISIPIYHAANSAGAMEVPGAHYNLVRTGIALYGLYPSEEVCHTTLALTPALSLISNVIFVKEVPENTPISYGGTYVTKRPTKIATIPVGYGDGYARALSSKGRVIIHGQYAPIIGRVCMDQFMVDVTDIEGVSVRDEAILIGKQGACEITVEEIARHMNTINYEVVCQIGKRVPRVYMRDGKPVFSIDYF